MRQLTHSGQQSATDSASRYHLALDWLEQGHRVIAASLIRSVGSAPLDPGAEMLVDDTVRIEGTVTGGCVEGALVELAQEVLAGAPAQIARYGISDEEAAGVGLMCGGSVEVFVHELSRQSREVLSVATQALEQGEPVALATVLDGPEAGTKMAVTTSSSAGTLRPEQLEPAVLRDALGCLDQGMTAIRTYSAAGETMGSEVRVYLQGFARPPEMVIFGAIDFSAAVAKLAREVGYAVTICDARAPFLSSPRFSQDAEVVVDWPDRYLATRELSERDVVLVFTHDPKFDEPALIAALASGAGYIGALGSRRTHAERTERLRERGVDEADLARIAAPCGLDIGARTPTETAISVLAEMLALRAGRSGRRLAETGGAIHPAPDPEM